MEGGRGKEMSPSRWEVEPSCTDRKVLETYEGVSHARLSHGEKLRGEGRWAGRGER